MRKTETEMGRLREERFDESGGEWRRRARHEGVEKESEGWGVEKESEG